jgi:peroxiredoxin
MSRQTWLLIFVAMVGIGAGLAVSWKLSGPEAPAPKGRPSSESLIGKTAPAFTLGSATGARVSDTDFRGQVLLVNFWATWCAPCVEEMPMLEALQTEYAGQGLQVVGIALDEVQRVRDFADELGITYPVLVGATDVMVTARLWGNHTGQLPYTVLVDRDGLVQWTRLGVLERETILPQLSLLF